jgi:hypothetical protein
MPVYKTRSSTPGPLTQLTGLIGLLASLGLGWIALSQSPPPRPLPVTDATEPLGAAPALAPCVMDERDGYWQGRMSGTADLEVDWRGSELGCAGEERASKRGLRLFFAGRPGVGADRLLVVLSIDSSLERLAGREHPVRVTLIDEASSQFFHSDGGRCFTRIREVAALAQSRGVWRVDGELYCVGAIASVAGDTAVEIGDTRFSGRLTQAAP